MSTPSFLDTLRSEVARMQATHPEREVELARAHALILHGMVVPSPEDPATGQVLSSDGQKVYHVNGTCSCDAGQHGRGCKHVHGWRLYQYVQRKLDAQASQTAQEPTSPPRMTLWTRLRQSTRLRPCQRHQPAPMCGCRSRGATVRLPCAILTRPAC
jgi:hypothetical protein